MNEQAEKSGVAFSDAFKIVLAAAALVGGLVAYYWFESQPQVLRVLMVLGGLTAGFVLLYWSAPGRELWAYVQSSRVELRKMVWPTRAETWRSTCSSGSSTGRSRRACATSPGREAEEVSLNWYVVHAYSNFEHKVASSLKERIKLHGLDEKFGEVLVPTEEVVEMRAGQKRKSERKFFPGYVLVQMAMSDEAWHLVKETPKVLGFIGGTSEKPTPITEKEANAILRRVEEGVEKPRPKVLFEPGEVVRVVDGPFNDFTGVVESVNYEKSRLQVAVQILGRSTPVELDFGQVEKV